MREEKSKCVCAVSFEVGGNAVLGVQSFQAIPDALVMVGDHSPIEKDLLNLKSKFDNFDRGGDCLGNQSCNTSEAELKHKVLVFVLDGGDRQGHSSPKNIYRAKRKKDTKGSTSKIKIVEFRCDQSHF